MSVGQSIGGILVGIDSQIFRTTPPAHELVAKGDPIPGVAAAGGGRLTVDLPINGREAELTGEGQDPPQDDPPAT